MMRIWKAGDAVQITARGKTVSGTVILASENGWSLALAFDANVGGYIGMMPVLWDEQDQAFRCLVNADLVLLEPAPAPSGAREDV